MNLLLINGDQFRHDCLGLLGLRVVKTPNLDRLAKESEFPQAVVCANDNIAAGICARAVELGYKVPEDFIWAALQ